MNVYPHSLVIEAALRNFIHIQTKSFNLQFGKTSNPDQRKVMYLLFLLLIRIVKNICVMFCKKQHLESIRYDKVVLFTSRKHI